jgi:hypothetical protein
MKNPAAPAGNAKRRGTGANAIGVDLSMAIQLRADEVIE